MARRRETSMFAVGRTMLVLLSLVISICVRTAAQSGNNEPPQQIWFAVNASFELTKRTRITAIAEKHNGEESDSFHQSKVGAVFSYRLKRLGQHFRSDNDKENEYNLVLGGGYEYVVTDESGGQKHEHRLLLQATPKFILRLGILAQDRNRVEFRWNAGAYNFRYRNRLTVERPFKIGKLRLSPYAAGELFWDRNHHAWNENQYAFGVQWSIRKLSKLNTYYLRQNCTTCATDPLNIFGVTINFFFDWPGKK